MTDVDKYSDAELRTKLQEYGYPVMPITNTTRKIMVKKLKLLMENKNKPKADARRSLGRYSSEEESDTDAKPQTKEKHRRATTIGTLMQPPSSQLPIKRAIQRYEEEEAPVSMKTEKIITTTTKIIKPADNDFDTGSDSEPETQSNNYSFKHMETSSPKPSSLSSYKLSSVSSDLKDVSVGRPSSRYSTFMSPPSSASDYAAERLNSIRSRLSLGSSVLDRPSYTSDTYEAKDDVETPFLSNFTKRLSRISSEKKDVGDYKSDYLDDNDTNGASNYIRNYVNKPIRHRDLTRSYGASKDNGSKNNLVSLTVIGLAFLFFVVVAVVYLGLHSGNSALDVIGEHEIPYCFKNPDKTKIGFDCVIDNEYPLALDLYKVLQPELNRKAIANKCENSAIKPYMTERDVINYVGVRLDIKDEKEISKHLTNLQVLILSNPSWGISLVYGEDDNMGTSPIQNMEQMVKYKMHNEIALTMLNPDLPWSCSLYLKVARIIYATLMLALIGFAVYGVNFSIKRYKLYQQKEKDEIFRMVSRIVDILQTNATDDGENSFLVINHVRDMILPMKDRQSMQKIWLKAVKFISENDSRIRTEIQVVQGEPYEVWRWLGVPNLNASNRSKSWQGQAFETQVGSVNSLQCSPTPCLKIRGMFEDDDRNLHTIREAVLSKCAHQCKILHCAVDTASKCVYLKCADQSDAAVAYRNLHGWWYAGNLVTVKYLRLERYMQRFPDSPINGPPFLRAIQPSADWNI